jgi:site-specific DNA recombinase
MRPGIIMTRVSTDEQNKGNSPEDQRRVCLEYAEQNGITIEPGMIFMEDYSGFEHDRPELNKIRAILKARKGMALIVRSGDRLARSVFVAGMLAEEFARYGVELHFVSRGKVDYTSPEGQFIFFMEAAGNQYWGQKAKEAMINGRKAQLRSGIPLAMGKPPYGYRKEGTKKETRYVIVEEYAAIVREIFDMLVNQGMSLSKIADNLNARGLITPMKAIGMKPPERQLPKGPRFKPSEQWTVGMLYNVIRHEIYSGVYIANKVTRDFKARKTGLSVTKPECEWIRIEDPERIPPIVDRAIWERAQEVLATTRNRNAFRPAIHDYLLARRIKCSCGYSATAHSARRRKAGDYGYYYSCNTKTKKHVEKCGTPYYRAPLVDAAVTRFIQEAYRNPHKLLEDFKRAQEQARQANAGLYEQLSQIERNIKRLEAQLEGLMRDKYTTESPRQQAVFDKLIGETERAIEEGEQQHATLSKRLAPTELPDALIQLLAVQLAQGAGLPEEASTALSEYLAEPIELPPGVTKSDGTPLEPGTYYMAGDDYLDRLRYVAEQIKAKQEEPETFESLRRKVEAMNLTGTLAFEEGEQVLYLHWGINTARMPLAAYADGSVDYVLTTGATMGACAEALRRAGASEVYGLALARSRPDY